jgi:hypothetical protein
VPLTNSTLLGFPEYKLKSSLNVSEYTPDWENDDNDDKINDNIISLFIVLKF